VYFENAIFAIGKLSVKVVELGIDGRKTENSSLENAGVAPLIFSTPHPSTVCFEKSNART